MIKKAPRPVDNFAHPQPKPRLDVENKGLPPEMQVLCVDNHVDNVDCLRLRSDVYICIHENARNLAEKTTDILAFGVKCC